MAKSKNLRKDMAMMLTEDLMSEILVRLPVSSLFRCRCVCKAWFHLIKSPNFINMHIKHSSSKEDRILISRNLEGLSNVLSIHAYESFGFVTSIDLDPYLDYYSLKICGPCNGLLCLVDMMERELTLYNPSTGEYTCLPPRPFSCRTGWIYYLEGFGLGFVSNPSHYKVITLVGFYDVDSEFDDDDEPVKVEIYDLSTNSWREIDCDCPYYVEGDEYGTLFNGSLHWTARREGIDIIPSFNLSTEMFRDMELPNDLLGKNGINKCLTIINNSLALFAYTNYHYNSEEQFIDIWIMKVYGVTESWTKQVSIGPLSGILSPLMLWKNEAILLESFEGQLLSCDLDTHEIEEFDIQGDRGSMRVMVYQESLVSLE